MPPSHFRASCLGAVELVRLEAEIARTRKKHLDLGFTLQAMLLFEVRLEHEGGETLEKQGELEAACTGSANPWAPLLARVDEFPELRVLHARARAAEAAATVADQESPFVVGVGGGGRYERPDGQWIGLGLSLEVPLRDEGGAERARALAEAAAFQTERRWRSRQLHALLRAESERFDASVTLARSLRDDVLARLVERQERLEDATAKGHLELEAVIRAWRDLHEAHHDVVEAITEVAAHRGRAGLIADFLDRLALENRRGANRP